MANLRGTIFVWRLEETPRRFRAVTERQGDELWLVAIPASMPDFVPPDWLLRNVEEHVLPNGDRVMVGD